MVHTLAAVELEGTAPHFSICKPPKAGRTFTQPTPICKDSLAPSSALSRLIAGELSYTPHLVGRIPEDADR